VDASTLPVVVSTAHHPDEHEQSACWDLSPRPSQIPQGTMWEGGLSADGFNNIPSQRLVSARSGLLPLGGSRTPRKAAAVPEA